MPSQRNDKSDTGKEPTWLGAFARNVTSQHGEDGIIEKVLAVIGENDRWCVEFGSWDGRHCSNTFHLIDQEQYSAVLIEGNSKRFKDLLATFAHNDRVTPINTYVGFGTDDSLDSILGQTDIPANFDLLSIDIDGNDYHVWKALTAYKPKAVIIEFNPTIPPSVEFVQPADPKLCQGSSLLSISQLAREKGYELVCATSGNAIFVDAKYFPQFGIEDNSPGVMMTDRSLITHIFCGYDGTVFLGGNRIMPWQSIPYEESRVQQLPRWARKVVNDRNVLRRKARKLYLRLRRKRIS
jgi:hypothetical protein